MCSYCGSAWQGLALPGVAGCGLARQGCDAQLFLEEKKMKYSFTIEGQTPFLMHADNVELADTLMEWRKDSKNKGVSKSGDDRSPGWTWQTCLYSENDLIVLPTDNISTCLREAGAMITLKGKTTFKQASQSGLFFLQDSLPLFINGTPVSTLGFYDMRDKPFDEQREACQKAGFELMVKRAKIGTAKHIRVRPLFRNWSASGTVEVLAKEITKDILQEMFSLGGRYKGVGDWRPSSKQSPGRYGMFTATVTPISG